MDEFQPIDRLSIAAFLQILARRWHIVLLCAIVVPAVAYYITSGEEKRYETRAKVLFRDSGLDQQFPNTPGLPSGQDPERQAATILDLLELPVVAQRTARALGGRTTAGEVASAVSPGVTGESDVYSIEAQTNNRSTAARLANTYATQFVAYRREGDRAQLARTRRTLQREVRDTHSSTDLDVRARREALRDRIAELRVIESLQDGDVEVVQRAEAPGSPVSPKPRRNTVIGLGLGLLLGVGLALLFEALDRRMRSMRSIETTFDRPVLGAIPKSRALAAKTQSILPPGEQEAFRMLRANLRYYHDDRGPESVLVTSASRAEGKTTVAWNLAAAAAEAGSYVLLIEADMRRPVLAKRLGASPVHGLSDVLSRGVTVDDALVSVALGDPERNGTRPRIDVIFGGPPLTNPIDQIESARTVALLQGAEKRYDLVVVDAPPLSVVPDAIPLIRQVSGVVVVSRLGKSTREAAEHMRDQLGNLGASTLGVVVNGIQSADGVYGDAYRAAEDYVAIEGERRDA